MPGGEKKTKGTIYSISVHPDGTRLATGGVGKSIEPISEAVITC
jgi:protein HIRA/HIR1